MDSAVGQFYDWTLQSLLIEWGLKLWFATDCATDLAATWVLRPGFLVE